MGDAFDGSEIIDLSITMERTAIIDFFILYYRFKWDMKDFFSDFILHCLLEDLTHHPPLLWFYQIKCIHIPQDFLINTWKYIIWILDSKLSTLYLHYFHNS